MSETLSIAAGGARRKLTGELRANRVPHIILLYWIAFLIANTLGAAAGDYLADDLEFGFVNSAILISGLLAVIAASPGRCASLPLPLPMVRRLEPVSCDAERIRFVYDVT